jgi:hypothetical protein
MQVNNKQMPQAADQQPPQGTEQTYAVTVDGQTLELTLEQLIAAAEQGLSRANDAVKNGQSEGMPTQMRGQLTPPNVYQSFLSAYPDINAQDIPSEVWDEANRSGDLLDAYRAYEIRKLREELEQLRKNADNRRMDVGSARSDGENNITDPIILALMGKG